MLYLNLYNDIKQRILEGHLSPGEKLPSKRQMAKDRGVSINTVTASLDQLAAEGYIEAIQRKGYYVLSQKLNLKEPEHWNVNELRQENTPKIDWRYKGVDPEFPIATWKKLTLECLNLNPNYLTEKGPKLGEHSLRQAISTYLWNAKGIKASPSHIIVGSSTENLLLLLVKLIGKAKIGVEDPGFHRWGEFLRANQIEQIPIRLDEEGANPDSFDKNKMDLLYVTPSYQFPTGSIMTIGRKQALLEWVNDDQKWIIEDEYNGEFRYEGKPIPPLKAIDYQDRVIYLQSFSSLISPALRISFMLLPDQLMQQFSRYPYYFSCPVPRLTQNVLAQFMSGGYFTRHVNRMRRKYSKKRQMIEKWASQYTDLRIIGTNAGLHLLLSISNNPLSEKEIIDAVKTHGMALSPLSDYEMIKKTRPASFVIGYGKASLSELEAGMKVLEEVLQLKKNC
ncbi:MocR-like pyridoxine biosynthesis transcription factor PdxR [Facklamia miroungae]|uniref:GntR family transcriptional regulator / MocR family aminotransferase n=1 Tax=Facklamia miroungae TaxID=120956 RepID=A0A1G7PW48_9LACT|nr:PLP-dependent aminotransferase family protein [Facklamia miroungae]NKZ28831.1 PLP-dependent aminotransferase family protein [Facklamia miroungae]SDF89819.1 GntR family transcriptional regulator / MocR family aminotransferase [Facklamia miroungae]